MKRRKRESKALLSLLGKILTALFFLFVLFVMGSKTGHILKSSDYFIIHEIVYDPSWEFPHPSRLNRLKGQSLLTVDLKAIHKELQSQYPQAGQLKLTKRFPHTIVVAAQRRAPFAQTVLWNQNITLDANGIVLSTTDPIQKDLPWIAGLNATAGSAKIGTALEGQSLLLALRILRAFGENPALANYRILKIDIGNLSEIDFYLSNNLRIIMDRENINYKMRILGVVLNQVNLESGDVKYIDLRFREPIIGKKDKNGKR